MICGSYRVVKTLVEILLDTIPVVNNRYTGKHRVETGVQISTDRTN